MKKVLLISTLLSIVMISGCIRAVEYGLTGVPKINLIEPSCNSTVNNTPTFVFTPQPSPYHHYLLKIKQGTEWVDENYIEFITDETSINYSSISETPLPTGDYLYNVIGYDSNNNSQAGSSPCKFTVI
jgi:hypothetical protein